ncbi:hypothetical protein [Peptostreptococcus faecalis]|uniref:hypothetical protein n=1 Tax=Peptostreptococcus faecalis TaxID=2045015 RepID=UPI000C7CD3D2|nr:hypothetical protein [Peptostreptococcus faecalis]
MKISELQNGELDERISYELQKIFENIEDPNTDEKKVRSLTITLKFKPNGNNEMVELDPALKTSLAPVKTNPTTIIVDKDFSTGKVSAKEYNKQIKGQIDIAQIEEESNDEGKKVIDLRASK